MLDQDNIAVLRVEEEIRALKAQVALLSEVVLSQRLERDWVPISHAKKYYSEGVKSISTIRRRIEDGTAVYGKHYTHQGGFTLISRSQCRSL